MTSGIATPREFTHCSLAERDDRYCRKAPLRCDVITPLLRCVTNGSHPSVMTSVSRRLKFRSEWNVANCCMWNSQNKMWCHRVHGWFCPYLCVLAEVASDVKTNICVFVLIRKFTITLSTQSPSLFFFCPSLRLTRPVICITIPHPDTFQSCSQFFKIYVYLFTELMLNSKLYMFFPFSSVLLYTAEECVVLAWFLYFVYSRKGSSRSPDETQFKSLPYRILKDVLSNLSHDSRTDKVLNRRDFQTILCF